MIELTVLYEVSDHYGYCSGDECEYKSYTKTVLVPIPYFYDQLVINENKIENCDKFNWEAYIEKPH